jgi:polar amino acid transport system substrate-binding protein
MRRIVTLMLALLSPLPALASEVVLAVSHSTPPYLILEDWRGLEYDIVREALAQEGHTVAPRYMAFARIAREIESGQVDAAMPVLPDSGIKAFYSDNHVSYHNVVITLAKNNFTIARPEDLAGKSVLAFQHARSYLGPAFHAMAEANGLYREEARQTMQPVLLYLGRVDAVVSDRFIFGWFANDPEVKTKADTSQTLRIHRIFPATHYRVAFKSAEMRDSFNRGLKKLRDSGEYDRIVKRYSPYLKEEGGG